MSYIDQHIQCIIPTDFSLPNRHPLFHIYEPIRNSKGFIANKELALKGLLVQKPEIARGFLTTRWIKRADKNLGFLMSEADYYELFLSDRLSKAVELCALAGPLKAVRAICSFQTLTNGDKRAVCQVFDSKAKPKDYKDLI